MKTWDEMTPPERDSAYRWWHYELHAPVVTDSDEAVKTSAECIPIFGWCLPTRNGGR